jgi:hypothetical protein
MLEEQESGQSRVHRDHQGVRRRDAGWSSTPGAREKPQRRVNEPEDIAVTYERARHPAGDTLDHVGCVATAMSVEFIVVGPQLRTGGGCHDNVAEIAIHVSDVLEKAHRIGQVPDYFESKHDHEMIAIRIT